MRSVADREILFRSWLEEHGGIVTKVTAAFARTPSDVADLRQEVLLQLWLSLPSFAGHAKPSTWIYRVCLNTAIGWRRKSDRHDRVLAPEATIDDCPTPAIGPAESAGRRDILETLYTAVRALPEFDRALVLLLLDGVTYHDIAEVTGMSETHVGVALTRARKRLAALMKGVADELE